MLTSSLHGINQADSRPLYIADIQSAADEKRYSLTTDMRDRFLQIARDKYGVSSNPQFGAFDKKQSTDAVFARLDWQINATNLLTFTDNFVNDMNNLGLGTIPLSVCTKLMVMYIR